MNNKTTVITILLTISAVTLAHRTLNSVTEHWMEPSDLVLVTEHWNNGLISREVRQLDPNAMNIISSTQMGEHYFKTYITAGKVGMIDFAKIGR